eukprot:573654-Rhodomonas_salina.7
MCGIHLFQLRYRNQAMQRAVLTWLRTRRSLRGNGRSPPALQVTCDCIPGTDVRTCYGMSGTDVAYGDGYVCTAG